LKRGTQLQRRKLMATTLQWLLILIASTLLASLVWSSWATPSCATTACYEAWGHAQYLEGKR
jgi:hypothetical protein